MSLLQGDHLIYYATLVALLSPLLGWAIGGVGRHVLGRSGTQGITILGVVIACVSTLFVAKGLWWDHAGVLYEASLYHWINVGGYTLNLGLYIDPLTVMMMMVVSFISLLVHIYSVGYMHDDESAPRFFSYMSLFTFAMLVLVSANNLLQLFFGWEGVGVVSYLLIGFWFKRESAVSGGLKAFLVNRVGDLGLLLGMGLILAYTGHLDYSGLFAQASALTNQSLQLTSNLSISIPTLIGLLVFIGAMGKSAQIPLHVWLPESMEGPTPISALIHAATMVTAGVYLLARLSPIYALSETALSVILVIGATGALFMGLIGIVQNDIKRVVAYSTLSQLGYMIAGIGAASAATGLFHLMTHAFFKALLFLGAGSVIVALHHEQDIRKMGNLKAYLPITYITFLLGTLSLTAIPPFSGFYSKDAIIEAVQTVHLPGSGYAYICLLVGAFVTAFYSFRLFFLVFHTDERLEHPEQIKESFASILWPLILLAIPSVIIGALLAGSFVHTKPGFLGKTVDIVLGHHHTIEHHYSWFASIIQAMFSLPFWFSLAGIISAWVIYVRCPLMSDWFYRRLRWLYVVLDYRYGFDAFYNACFVKGTKGLSHLLYRFIDTFIIDNGLVNGIGRLTRRLSHQLGLIQTGYLYHYAFAMMVGLTILLLINIG